MTLNEREAFEALPQIKGILDGESFYFSSLSMNYKPKNPKNENHLQCTYFLNGALYAWEEKAKAQAVPDGHVLVNSESLLFHAQSIRMFNDGDCENHYEEIEEHVCAIEEIVKASESGAEG